MNAHPPINDHMHDQQAEGELLGALMSATHADEAYARASSMLEPHHFYATPHKLIYESIQALQSDGKAVTPISLNNHLPSDIYLQDTTTIAYLMQMQFSAAPLMAVIDYAEIVLDTWSRRCLQEIAATASDLAASKGQGVLKSLNTLDEELSAVRQALTAKEVPMDMSAAVKAANRHSHGKAGDQEASIPLPWPSVKSLIGEEMEPAGLYGILGASQEGKTSFVLPIMRTAAENGHPCAMLSFDQSPVKCVDQLCSQSLGIEGKRIRSRDLKESEWTGLFEERDRLAKLPLSVIPCSSGKLSDVANVAQSFLQAHKRKTVKTPVIVIDHIGSLQAPDPRADHGSKAFAKADYFREFAKRHNCVVIMLLQRNSVDYKTIATRPPRPTKRDIEGGEAARRPFDAIVGVFRPEFWRNEALKTVPEHDDNLRSKIEGKYPNCDGVIELHMVKARYSDDRAFRRMRFEAAYTRISEFERKQPSLLDDAF